MERFPITEEGHVKLKAELEQLKVERPAVARAIAEARGHGDLSENAEYSAAKEKQRFIENRISQYEDQFNRAEVIDTSKICSDKVEFGAYVEIIDHEANKVLTYRIVGAYEADASNMEISIYSPVAKAMLNKKVGDEVEVNAPRGIKYYEISKIWYS